VLPTTFSSRGKTLEATGTISVPTLTTDIPEVVTLLEGGDFENETALSIDIAQLWDNHVALQSNVYATREELRTIRAGLGDALCQMKRLLASPGRGGQWSEFLPKGTSLALPPIASFWLIRNLCGRRIALMTQFLTHRKWPPGIAIKPSAKLRAATPEHVYRFVWDLTTLCGKSIRELRPNGFLVLRPAPEIGDPFPVTDLEWEVAGEYSEAI
jgi:hypothetical protein